MDIYITHQTYCLDQLIYLNMICHPPISTLFPYTTLFRSLSARKAKLIPTELAAWVGHGLFDHLVGLEENRRWRSEEHTSELQSHSDLVCRLLLEKKKGLSNNYTTTISVYVFVEGIDVATS